MIFLLYTFQLEFCLKIFVLDVELDWFLIRMIVLAHALLILILSHIRTVELLAEFAQASLDSHLLMENVNKELHLHQLPLQCQ